MARHSIWINTWALSRVLKTRAMCALHTLHCLQNGRQPPLTFMQRSCSEHANVSEAGIARLGWEAVCVRIPPVKLRGLTPQILFALCNTTPPSSFQAAMVTQTEVRICPPLAQILGDDQDV